MESQPREIAGRTTGAQAGTTPRADQFRRMPPIGQTPPRAIMREDRGECMELMTYRHRGAPGDAPAPAGGSSPPLRPIPRQ